MAQRDRNRVGRIDGPKFVGELQLCSDHAFDLLLVGISVAGYGELDFVRAVLHHVALGQRRCSHHHSRCVTDRHGGADIYLEQDPLDGDDSGTVLVDELGDIAMQYREPSGKLLGGVGTNHTSRNGANTRWASPFDTAVAASGQPRVDSENEHLYDTTSMVGVDTR